MENCEENYSMENCGKVPMETSRKIYFFRTDDVNLWIEEIIMKNRRSTTKAYFITFASGILHFGHFPKQLFIYLF